MKPIYWEKSKVFLRKKDPIMAQMIDAISPKESLTASVDPFSALAKSIIGQQLSVPAAATIWQRFSDLVQEITPEKVRKTDVEHLRSQGLSYQKCNYLHQLSDFFLCNREWEPDRLSDNDIREKLLGIKGIGHWTVDMFLIFYCNRPDIFPIGDLGILKAVNQLYFSGGKQPKEAYLKLSGLWRPYRTVASWYLWRYLDSEPVQY